MRLRVSCIFAAVFAIAAVLLYMSIVTEWWVLEAHDVGTGRWSWLRIYAYGLVHNMSELRQYMMRHETPPALMAAAKVFTFSLVGLTVLAALLLATDRKWAWKITLAVGVVYLFYSLAFIPVLHEGTSTAPRPLPVEGETFVSMYGYTVRFITRFETGYYLALASSIFLIAASLLVYGWLRLAGRQSGT